MSVYTAGYHVLKHHLQMYNAHHYIKKEHKRVQVIKDAGYTPIRIMFFEPNREQAIRIQAKLKQLYKDVGGEYYAGEDAWNYLMQETGVNLKELFKKIKE